MTELQVDSYSEDVNVNTSVSDSEIREQLITTAIHFLHNTSVQRSSINQKQKFLRSKGLTEREIQVAFERAGVFTIDPNNTSTSTIINFDITQQKDQNQLMHPPQKSVISYTFSRFKEILNSIAIISGVCYIIFTFYKRFIEPILFSKKKKPSIIDKLNEIDQKVETKMNQLNQEVIKIHDEINSSNQTDLINRELSNFKNDLDSIKGLLLNRKQFAAPLMVSSSIPQWQLQSAQHNTDAQDNDKHETDSASAGSGSSETEVVIKNSDSSIEIM